MLDRFVLAVLVSGLVPIFGLMSCSKDRSDDSWGISEPILVRPSASVPLSRADHMTLEYSTKIEFRGEAWSKLIVKSQCRLGSERFSENFELSYRDSIDVRALWPRTLTSNLDDIKLSDTQCDFDFQALNQSGSTHDFSIRDVTLNGFVDLEDSLLKRRLSEASAKLMSHESAAVENPLAVQKEIEILTQTTSNLLAQLRSPTDLALVCGDQSISTPVRSDASTTIQDLLLKSSFSGRRRCHLLASTQQSELNEFAMSAETLMRFTNLQLTISQRTALPALGQPILQQIEITNPNPEEAVLRLSANSGSVKARFIFLFGSTLFADTKESEYQLSVKIEGARSLDDSSFALPPGGRAIVSFLSPTLGVPPCGLIGSRVGIVGLRWGLKSPLTIQQLDSENDPNGSILFGAPVISNTYSYPASYIHEFYQKDFGPTVPEWVLPATPSQQLELPRC